MAFYGTTITETYAADMSWLRGDHAQIEVLPCTLDTADFEEYKVKKGTEYWIPAGVPLAYDSSKKRFIPFVNGTTGALEGFLRDNIKVEYRDPEVDSVLGSVITHCTIRRSRLPEPARAQITYESAAAAHGTIRLEVE